jgi:hypothetical protein
MFDLEVWLIGTPAELDAAARALAGLGAVVGRGERTALSGTDTGRWRSYARIRVAAAYRPPPGSPGQREEPATLTNLAA